MDFLTDWLTNWLKELLIGGIMGNLEGLFDTVNTQVGEIAAQVGTTPAAWHAGVFSLIRQLSETVILPIAGMVLTFVATYELIQMLLEKNNMHEVDVANLYKWMFKTACAILILSNTFNIVMAVFDVSQSVIAQAGGLIQGSTDVSADMLAELETSLEAMDLGPLLGLWLQSALIGFTMKAMGIIIFVLVYGRMLEIYLLTSLAPIPVATLSNRELGGTGQNYIKSLFAVGFQGLLILVCVAIYAVLIQGIATSGDPIGAIWGTVGYLKLSHGFEREKKEALTVAQQKLFFDYMLSHPKDTHWYPVFYVMANTGMRVGEITGLRWSDIDLKKGIIRVNHTLVYYNHRDEKGCYFSINTPKTKAGEREIPMTEGVKQAFLMEREFQSQAEISSKSRVDGYDDFIFVNRYGDVQNQGNLNKALRRMMRDCNDEILEKYGADSDPVLLPQFSCHILRHTFATRLCESGANLKFIQSILGHADVSTTMNIYVDVTDALKKKEITAFDDYMTTKLET